MYADSARHQPVWWVWYMDAKARLVDGLEVKKGEHTYKGWKTLPQTLRRLRAKKALSDV
jgi:hypothetical protein